MMLRLFRWQHAFFIGAIAAAMHAIILSFVAIEVLRYRRRQRASGLFITDDTSRAFLRLEHYI